MKKSELTIHNFPFEVEPCGDFDHNGSYQYKSKYFQNMKEHVVSLIRNGAKIELFPVSKTFSRDWKGLQYHTQKMIVEDKQHQRWVHCYRTIYMLPQGTMRQQMWAENASEWD